MADPVASRVLSGVEFDVVWESLGLGPTPVVLNLPSPGRTHTERRHIVAGALSDLRCRGLAGPAGPEPGLRHLLRLLATPTARVELRGWGPVTIRTAVAGHTDDGVVAQRVGDTVVLEPCTSLPTAVVAAFPAAPAGPGRTANVPTAVLAAALARPSQAGLRAHLVERGIPACEAGPAAYMLQGVAGRIQLGVVGADRWGALRRLPDVLGVVDTARGRYAVLRNRAEGDWTTITPIDARRLRHRVGELVSRAVDGARPGQSRSPWRISCRPDSVIEPDSDG